MRTWISRVPFFGLLLACTGVDPNAPTVLDAASESQTQSNVVDAAQSSVDAGQLIVDAGPLSVDGAQQNAPIVDAATMDASIVDASASDSATPMDSAVSNAPHDAGGCVISTLNLNYQPFGSGTCGLTEEVTCGNDVYRLQTTCLAYISSVSGGYNCSKNGNAPSGNGIPNNVSYCALGAPNVPACYSFSASDVLAFCGP